MRRRAFVAALLASSILLASCSAFDTGSNRRRNRDRDRDDDDDGHSSSFTRPARETSAETVPMPSETRASAETTETTAATSASGAEVSPEVYASYLEILEANEDAIRAYDWMSMESSSSDVLTPPEDTPCALYDVTGDGIEELFVMQTSTGYNADLTIYSYNAGSGNAEAIFESEGFDVLAGGGGRYLIGMLEDGFLFIYTGEGDEDWTNEYQVYAFDGTSSQMTGLLVEISHLDDGQYEYVYEYELNGQAIDEDTFETSKATFIEYIESVIMYNYISDPDMVAGISNMTPIAMSYDDMHSYLEGLS